jgi:serine protease Do
LQLQDTFKGGPLKMATLLRSKWVMAIVLLFAAFGVLAALSLVPIPFVSRGGQSLDAPKFVPVAYAEPAPSNEDFAALQRVNRALTQVVQQARASVVSIETEATPKVTQKKDEGNKGDSERSFPFELPFPFQFRTPNPDPIPRQGVGSGVIVSPDGYILTNNHVVEDADRITVRFDDGTEQAAKLIGRDPRSDIAVVKVDKKGLAAMPLGDSDALQVGEFVIAIGTPFRLAQSVSMGIVSAKERAQIIGRSDPESAPYEDFIQTDAAINPGNSGGALVNIYGQLIGINTAINSRTGGNEGVGFAVPINMARRVMTDLIEKGKVVRSWLGVYITDVSSDVAQELKLGSVRGALVSQVQDNSPAKRAGLKPYDIILRANEIEVKNSNQLRNYISSSPVGREVDLLIYREGKEKHITVRLAELDDRQQVASAPKADNRETANGWMGITVEDLTSDKAEELGYKGESGVLVTKVDPGSPADRNGLNEGALILSISDHAISNLKDYKEAVKNASDSALVKWRWQQGYRLAVLKKDGS